MFNKHQSMRLLYWMLIGILTFLFLYLLNVLFPFYRSFFATVFRILAPFIIAGLIAYLLHPIVEKLHEYKVPRWLAIIGIYILFFGGLGYLAYLAYPVFITQLRDLNDNIPDFINRYRSLIYDLYVSTSFLPETVHDKMDEFFYDMEETLGAIVTNAVKNLTKIMDVIFMVAVIPVLVFYMLKDFNLIKEMSIKVIPKKYRDESKVLLAQIDESFGGYLRGQLLVCFFVGLTTYGIFLLIGMKYALVLAIILGVADIIPYFGPILGAVPAVIIAFTISTKMVVLVILAVLIIQIIEGNLLSPLIVGKSINMHPLLIIFALLVGGEIGGVIGMVIAVPLLAIIKVVLFHTRAYKASS